MTGPTACPHDRFYPLEEGGWKCVRCGQVFGFIANIMADSRADPALSMRNGQEAIGNAVCVSETMGNDPAPDSTINVPAAETLGSGTETPETFIGYIETSESGPKLHTFAGLKQAWLAQGQQLAAAQAEVERLREAAAETEKAHLAAMHVEFETVRKRNALIAKLHGALVRVRRITSSAVVIEVIDEALASYDAQQKEG